MKRIREQYEHMLRLTGELKWPKHPEDIKNYLAVYEFNRQHIAKIVQEEKKIFRKLLMLYNNVINFSEYKKLGLNEHLVELFVELNSHNGACMDYHRRLAVLSLILNLVNGTEYDTDIKTFADKRRYCPWLLQYVNDGTGSLPWVNFYEFKSYSANQLGVIIPAFEKLNGLKHDYITKIIEND
ncbi:MAG: hypothetical protein NDI94_01455 [Candidatus Woesearchaeota archaeon]|nr:hypothetical protein [Candidatus Woesearchaeota archaeon]